MRRGQRTWLAIAATVAFACGVGCSSTDASEAAAPADASAADARADAAPVEGGACQKCSDLLTALADPCSIDAGGAGPSGGGSPSVTFCKADEGQAFLGCFIGSCADTCGLDPANPAGGGPGGGRCGEADASSGAGQTDGSAADAAAPGAACVECIKQNCSKELAACD